MQKQHRAYILRVDKKLAGSEIPFDKIYLFHKDDEKLLPAIYRNAIVLPLTTALVRHINVVVAAETVSKPTYSSFPSSRWRKSALTKETKEKNPFVEIGVHRKYYVALIPTFFTSRGNHKVNKGKKRLRKGKPSVFASYLTASGARSKAGSEMMRRVVSVKSYFILNGKVVRPICMMCPRHLHFLEGTCVIGDDDCYTYLAQAKRTDMVEGLQRYEELIQHCQEPNLGPEVDACQATKKPESTS